MMMITIIIIIRNGLIIQNLKKEKEKRKKISLLKFLNLIINIIMNKEELGPIGIDLGTTNCCVGIWNKDHVDIITNDFGYRTTPSYVAFTDVQRLVGNSAKNQMKLNPMNTVFDTKRLIGKKINDKTVQEDIKRLPFKICEKKGIMKIKVTFKKEDKYFSPEEISAMILTKIKKDVEKKTGKIVKKAVITVPAYFNNKQKEITKLAGEIAGLDVIRIINEPTAAALAYGLDKTDLLEEKLILVFDIGGGTFDVTLLEQDGSLFKVKAISGDAHLGGEDFDNLLVDYCISIFKKRQNISIDNNISAKVKLKNACEEAKKQLSSSDKATIFIDSLVFGTDFKLVISKNKFDRLCNKLIMSTIETVKQVLKDGNTKKNDIDEVILVGGSSRIPKLQTELSKFFDNKVLSNSVNPDEAVAQGAAIQGAILNGDNSKKIRDVLVYDAAPLSLGIEIGGKINKIVVPKNSKIPTSKTMTVTTASNNQTSVCIRILEGERAESCKNNLLGEFVLSGIAPYMQGKVQVVVTYRITADGLLIVSAKENSNNISNELKVSQKDRTVESEEISYMKKEAEKYEQEDKLFRKKYNKRSLLENTAYKYLTFVEDSEKKLSGKNKKNIKGKAEEILDWLEEDDNYTIKEYEEKQKDLMLVMEIVHKKIKN